MYFSSIDVVGAETDENRVFALLIRVDQVRLLADLRSGFGIADRILCYDTIFRRVRFANFRLDCPYTFTNKERVSLPYRCTAAGVSSDG